MWSLMSLPGRKLCRKFTTSFPGSLLFTSQGAREGRPWLGLVTYLPESGRLQISDWREGRLRVSLPILSVPGMGKHAPVRINLQFARVSKVILHVVIQKLLKKMYKASVKRRDAVNLPWLGNSLIQISILTNTAELILRSIIVFVAQHYLFLVMLFAS